ncbi:calcium-translocating P-type ATPase, PMCA-type [Candidatus Xianfuyuplasma coldseepsis]|uniref:P-type Ca(2+) transporter n=1 Tax=Candidatus Xianfuyuplasma coldseepsis TaxID=2782163 RepID=A0A7L7KRR4_9MOLU|nr:calcium-translocating P-type ATPase, PMCA-type [Xianfuyuplasma coldseepsis]QMS85511.1 calcium-translocating P-type ATPase, PMCA-type [Xianfuyuplasma coldseepsis]
MKQYVKTRDQLRDELQVDPEQGLTASAVITSRDTHGSNKLEEKQQEGIVHMIIGELTGFLNILLMLAAIVSIIASHHIADGAFIFAIVILNTGLSVFQERKASNAVSALKSISAPHAKVLRDGSWQQLDSTLLVVGDIVLLEAGDYVPADMRLLETTNLKIDESALTGESVPVDKDAEVKLSDPTPIGDRINMAYMSTIVTYGRGLGLVTEVGMKTEIGNIADLLNEVEDEMTPLQRKIDHLGKLLGTVSIVVVILIFAVGLLYNAIGFTDFAILDLFMVSVSLAVAAIPEGLPTVITVVLSLGMRKMATKKAIVKELNAVETLGSTTVISSDKTGTLTQNKMVVQRLFDNNKVLEVTGQGYDFAGEIKGSNENVDLISRIGLLCNDAKIEGDTLIGDPTELALIPLAAKNKLNQEETNKRYPRVDEFPFDSDRKRMSTLHQVDSSYHVYTKGAPDQLLKVCNRYLLNGEIHDIDETFVQVVNLANQGMAHNALRVLGFAYKELSDKKSVKDEEKDLIFVGLVGIIDPPREEVKDAIKICHKAGIRVVMITGDHKLTASAIGKELGIITSDKQAMSGEEIDALSYPEFLDLVRTTNVFARVSPNHKVMIVKALQETGEISSMTGDGVNDAPALKQANIGVAMGITGTDVSKEAADMVLMDDNFTTIVDAVEEGRVIYANIRKFVAYLVSCNVGEVLLIFVAMLLGWGSPLLPIQILWINLVTDSFPAFALGLEKKEYGVMDHDPIDPQASIVDRRMGIAVLFQAVFLTTAVLISYYIGAHVIATDVNLGSTLAFITIITGELLRTYSARSETTTIFKMNPFDNKLINYAALFGMVLLLIVLFVPGINTLFRTNVHLTVGQFFTAFALGFIPLFGGELAKLFK